MKVTDERGMLLGGGDSPLGDDDQRDVTNAPLCVARAWDEVTSTTLFDAQCFRDPLSRRMIRQYRLNAAPTAVTGWA